MAADYDAPKKTDDDAESLDALKERSAPTSAASLDAEEINIDEDHDREAQGGRDEPAPKHAEARFDETDDGLPELGDKNEQSEDEEEGDHAGRKRGSFGGGGGK
jgi:hypothetical protein